MEKLSVFLEEADAGLDDVTAAASNDGLGIRKSRFRAWLFSRGGWNWSSLDLGLVV